MPIKKFEIGVKAGVNASMNDSVLDLYFLDTIQNPEYFDWSTFQMEEGNLVKDIIDQVQAYKPTTIKMHIDSLGGDLTKAISIYNFLKDYPAKVECKILGFCASAATVLACAASKGKLTMPVSGFHITHEASAQGVTGTVKELQAAIDYTDKLTQQMAEILAARNTKGHTAEEIRALWKEGDCWMSGEEACDYGFVDACYNAEMAMVTARIDEAKALYKTNKEIKIQAVAQPAPQQPEQTSNEDKNLFMNLKEKLSGVLATIKGKKIDTSKPDVMAQISAALEAPLGELMTEVETQVSAELATITDEVSTKVTAALENKYQALLDGLKEENSGLKADLEALTADVTRIVGKAAGTGGKKEEEGEPKGKRSLAGKGKFN